MRAYKGVAQREAAARRQFDASVGEGCDGKLLGLLTKQDSESCRRVHARGFALLRELVVHRAGHVDDESGRSRKLLESGDALEQGLFKRVLELRSVTRRRHETKRQRASDALVQPLANELRFDARCQHQAKVAQDGQAAQLALAQESLEVLALVLPCGQGNLPGIRRFERVLNELLPECGLRFVLRLRVAEEKHVAELDRRIAVVLRKLVGVELRECPRQPALYARGKRLLLFFPVERHELPEFVSALDHVLERLRHERARALAAREFACEEERRVTKLHFAACFPRESRYNLRLVLGGERGDALRDVIALLVEGVFPEQAGEHRAPEFALRVHLLRHRSFMRPHGEHPLPYVHLCHCCHSSFPQAFPILVSSPCRTNYWTVQEPFAFCCTESMHRPRIRRTDVKLAVGIVDADQIPFFDPEYPR